MQLVDDRLTVGRALMKSDQLILDPAQAAGQLAQARAIRAGRRSGRLLVHFAHGCHLTHPDTSQKACLTRWNGTSPDYCRKSGISGGGASGLDNEFSLSRAGRGTARCGRGAAVSGEGRWNTLITSKCQCASGVLVRLIWRSEEHTSEL